MRARSKAHTSNAPAAALIWRLGIALLAAAFVSACSGTKELRTFVGGVCEVVPEQPFVVLGKTDRDQIWIDETEISMQGACPGRAKPKERPPSLDLPKRAAPAPAPPPAKRHFWQRKPPKVAAAGFVVPLPRIRPAVARESPVEPLETIEVKKVAPEEEIAPVPAEARKTEPLDDLLDPRPSAAVPPAKRNSCWWLFC